MLCIYSSLSPSIVRPRIVDRLGFLWPPHRTVQLLHLALPHPLTDRVRVPKEDLKMNDRSHSHIYLSLGSEPRLSFVNIPDNPGLVHDDLSFLHALQSNGLLLCVLQVCGYYAGDALGTEAHLGDSVVDVFVCDLSH
jgi:hypothetical protein